MVEIENESEKKYKYDAFISYRHIEPDLTIAKILHEMIEKFNIPKHLRTVSNDENSINDKHVFRVFRDREELSTKDLSTMIEEAIANSKNLIVICSKRTSLSPWCRKEVQLFKKIHGVNNIIPVLIEGEPDEAFIDELKNLKAIGVNVQIKTYQCASYVVFVENPSQEKGMFLMAWNIANDDPDELLYALYHSSQIAAHTNVVFYKNEDFDNLISKARETMDKEKRIDLYKKAQDIIQEELAHYAILYSMQNFAYKKNIKGIEVNKREYFNF